jgi:PadR family transcriptional regulator AphA
MSSRKAPPLRLGPTSYLVLGLIGLRGPSTPYDLKRAAARSVAYFWSFPHSQLYSEPDRLAAAGLLEIEREEGGRNRKVYDLTEAGRHALRTWLESPPLEMPELRDTALLQLFFGEFASREALARLADEQGKRHRERLAIYEEIAQHYAGRSDRRRRLAPLGIGFALEKAYIQFWKTIAAELE